MITTQLGGKFSVEDNGLFNLKKKLINSNIKVNYPKGESIVTVQNGVPLTFDPQKEKKSFYEIEIQYLKSIRDTDIHIVYNRHINDIGYIGESASMEIAYAILHNKHICLSYLPLYSNKVDPTVKLLIDKNIDKILILNILESNDSSFIDSINKYIENPLNYLFEIQDELCIYKIVETTLNSYMKNEIR